MSTPDLTPEQVTELRQLLASHDAAATTVESTAEETAPVKGGNPYYCPGCGKSYSYMRECVGKPEAPHKPIELVPTTELEGEPDKADVAAYAAWAKNLTPAPPSN